MKKLIIAVKNPHYVNNFSAVMPYLKTGTDVEVYFHEDPKARAHGLELEKNFDVLIEFDCVEGTRRDVFGYCEAGLLGAKEYYPQIRLPKSLQAMRLHQAMGDKIVIPAVFNDFDGGRDFTNKHNHPNCEKVVIKREHGATGDRQVLIDSHHLSAFLENIDLGTTRLKEKFPNAVFIQTKERAREVGGNLRIEEDQQAKASSASASGTEAEDTSDFFTGQDVVITEYIEEVTSEYRVLFSPYTAVAYPRVRHGKEFPTANMDKSMAVMGSPTLTSSVLTTFGAEGDEIIQEVIKATGLLFGSIDVFMKDGKIGVFEYQNQFGIVNLDPGLVQTLHREAIEYIARQYYS